MTWASRRGMRLFWVTAIALAVSTPAADAQRSGDRPLEWTLEQSLSWVESADPSTMLAEAMATGRPSFFTVCALACVEPAIRHLTYARCYATAAGKRVIDPTGDMISSERHLQLKARAFQLATRYNTLLREELDRTGRRRCQPGEEWDDYWIALTSLGGTGRTERITVSALALGDTSRDRSDFELNFQSEPDTATVIFERACALAPRYGIVGAVTFDVTSGDKSASPKRHPGFICRNGVMATVKSGTFTHQRIDFL